MLWTECFSKCDNAVGVCGASVFKGTIELKWWSLLLFVERCRMEFLVAMRADVDVVASWTLMLAVDPAATLNFSGMRRIDGGVGGPRVSVKIGF